MQRGVGVCCGHAEWKPTEGSVLSILSSWLLGTLLGRSYPPHPLPTPPQKEMGQMQNPRVHRGPDQQTGPGEKGVSETAARGHRAVPSGFPQNCLLLSPPSSPPPSGDLGCLQVQASSLPVTAWGLGPGALGRSRFLSLSELSWIPVSSSVRCRCLCHNRERVKFYSHKVPQGEILRTEKLLLLRSEGGVRVFWGNGQSVGRGCCGDRRHLEGPGVGQQISPTWREVMSLPNWAREVVLGLVLAGACPH